MADVPDSVEILGHRFKRMVGNDYDGFAGAPAVCYMYGGETVVLLYDPETGVVSEIGEDGSQVDWTPEQVN